MWKIWYLAVGGLARRSTFAKQQGIANLPARVAAENQLAWKLAGTKLRSVGFVTFVLHT